MSEGERAVTGLSGEEREALRRGWLEDLEANDMWGAGGAGIDGIEEAVARIVAERTRAAVERVDALVDEWATEGRSLVDHASSGRDVFEGMTMERCADNLRAALDCARPADGPTGTPGSTDTTPTPPGPQEATQGEMTYRPDAGPGGPFPEGTPVYDHYGNLYGHLGPSVPVDGTDNEFTAAFRIVSPGQETGTEGSERGAEG